MVVTVGEPLDLSAITCRCNVAGEDQPKVWRDITARLRGAMLRLEERSPPNVNQMRSSSGASTSASDARTANNNNNHSGGNVLLESHDSLPSQLSLAAVASAVRHAVSNTGHLKSLGSSATACEPAATTGGPAPAALPVAPSASWADAT